MTTIETLDAGDFFAASGSLTSATTLRFSKPFVRRRLTCTLFLRVRLNICRRSKDTPWSRESNGGSLLHAGSLNSAVRHFYLACLFPPTFGCPLHSSHSPFFLLILTFVFSLGCPTLRAVVFRHEVERGSLVELLNT